MARIETGTLYGTLNLLILSTLAEGARHGLAVLQSIESQSETALRIEEGALYPALHRLQRDGLIEGSWGLSEKGRRARIYRLTRRGERQLERERSQWRAHARAISRVVGEEGTSG